MIIKPVLQYALVWRQQLPESETEERCGEAVMAAPQNPSVIPTPETV